MKKLSCLLSIAMVGCIFGAAAQALATEASHRGRSFYLDCGHTAANGSGLSPQSPWNSLARLNAMLFLPGDTIALKRGSVCHGVLVPKGSGSANASIHLTAYGEGVRPKVIAGPDAEESLKLFNQQYWDIDSLDLSGGRTYGVFISGDKGVLHHIHLENLAVHDVLGAKMQHESGGLVVISPGSVNQHFDDVVVDDVTAWRTNQWVGIVVGGGNLGYPPEKDWSTNAVIRNSAIHDVQGDGIILFRVIHGRIASSVAWNTGMELTQTDGTPNAIWTWMCHDCTVENNEAYLTDSPGVDGGAYDIDYGNIENSVIANYGHDTQGYCIAVFGAGFVTKDSLVRGNLCINNGRSPRMAKYQGAIFLLSWNGGSIDKLTMEDNTIYWNAFEDNPALLNEAKIQPGTAVFRDNTIYSTSPWMVSSNNSMTLAHNHYNYFRSARGTPPAWLYGKKYFHSLSALQEEPKQEAGSSLELRNLASWNDLWHKQSHNVGSRNWRLTCTIPVALNRDGLLADAALRQIVTLKSLGQQYLPEGLQVTLRLTSPDQKVFHSVAFHNVLIDLNLRGFRVEKAVVSSQQRMTLTSPNGAMAAQWNGYAGPVALGLALRKAMGEPIYAQMEGNGNE